LEQALSLDSQAKTSILDQAWSSKLLRVIQFSAVICQAKLDRWTGGAIDFLDKRGSLPMEIIVKEIS
jgi:hypothetical protein